ncbi:MAG TPA: DMT family transporter [Gemmatimonadaceae bacterium]
MDRPPRAVLSATLLVLFSACCFGSIAILITLGTRSGARLIDLLLWRYAVAAVLLVAVSGGMRAFRLSPSRTVKLLVLTGGGQAAIAFVTLSALKYIPAASLTFLFYTYPAWVAAISAVRRTERLTTVRVIALLLSLSGVAFMVGVPGAGGLNPTGVALALLGALIYAAYIPMMGHLGSDLPPAVMSTYASFGAAVIFLVASLATGPFNLHFTPVALASIALLAVVCTVFAFIAFLRGLAVIGPVRTAIISTIEPFWTALLAGAVLGQVPGPRTFVGGVLIASAVIVLQLAHARSGKRR